jgi:ribosome-binding factor A
MERIEKVNQLFKREISLMLQHDFQDPRLSFVTITRVVVSRDLQHAKVSYSFLGDEKQHAEIETILNQIRGYVRKLLGQRIRMRYIPELNFIFDKSTEYSARIEQALQDIKDLKDKGH